MFYKINFKGLLPGSYRDTIIGMRLRHLEDCCFLCSKKLHPAWHDICQLIGSLGGHSLRSINHAKITSLRSSVACTQTTIMRTDVMVILL